MNVMIGNRWTKEGVHQFLARGQWFGSLPGPMQEKILARSEIVHFPANAVLYKFGDPVDGVYAALDGDLRAYANGGDGERFFFRALGPGSWFGDANLLDPQATRIIDVCAASAATALFMPEPAYRELTESDPAIYRAFVQLLCIHARYASRIVIETRSEAPMRTARALLRLARAHGVAAADGTRLAMNLSQADLASLVGVSRQYMNELIARWEQEGFLRWNGKAQPMLDTERLNSLLGPYDAWIREHEDWV
jgi:CRP/FNR family transcriptional regulator, cyclic AMP receptor protein